VKTRAAAVPQLGQQADAPDSDIARASSNGPQSSHVNA
jgi:hypothetical protein